MNSSVKVLQPSGLLTGNNAKQLRYQIDDMINSGFDIILVDLQDVTFIDSFGLGTLIAAKRIVEKANCNFFICSIKDQVKFLFELNKVDQFFKIISDKDDFERIVFLT